MIWKKHKKIIAREFLILVAMFLFSFIVMTLVYFYAKSKDDNIKSIVDSSKRNKSANAAEDPDYIWYPSVKDIGERNQIWNEKSDRDSSKEIQYFTLLTVSILVYPIRFLYYAIKWSIKTLRHENQN
jgi:hypothetical protein